MAKLKLGEGTDPETTLGPMITGEAVAKILASLVDDAVAKGRKAYVAGRHWPPEPGRAIIIPPR